MPDFTITTPDTYLGQSTPSRAITLTTTATTGSTTSFSLSDGSAGGTFYPASPVTIGAGASGQSAQFAYIPSGTATNVTITVTATGGIAATHAITLPVNPTYGARYVSDTFQRTGALSGSTPDQGANWTTAQSFGGVIATSTGQAYQSVAGSTVYVINTAQPGSDADYIQTGTINDTTSAAYATLTALGQTNGFNCYAAYVLQNTSAGQGFTLYKYVSAVGTAIIPTGGTVVVGVNTVRLSVRQINSLQYLFLFGNGTLIGVVQDGTFTSGFIGLASNAGATSVGPAKGWTANSISGWNVDSVGATFPSATIFQSPGAWRNSNGAAILPTGGGYLRLEVTGTTQVVVNVDTTLNNGNGAADMPWLKVQYYSTPSDSAASYLGFPANNTNGTPVTLLSGLNPSNTYNVLITGIGANQNVGNGWTGTQCQTKINSFQFDAGATISLPPLRTKRALILGASYETGYFGGATTGNYYTYVDPSLSWPFFAAWALGAEYSQVGVGSQGWINTGNGGYPAFPASWNFYDSTHAKTLTGVFDYVFVHMGENDHAQSPSAVQAVISSWIVAARTAFGPTTKIFILLNVPQIQTTAIAAAVAGSNDPLIYLLNPGTEFIGTVFNSGSQTQGPATWASPDGLHLDAIHQAIYGAFVGAQAQQAILASPSSIAAAVWGDAATYASGSKGANLNAAGSLKVHNSTYNSDGVNVVQVDGVDARLGSLGGGGAFAMVINVKDQNNNPVPAATVRATGSALAWGATDNNGNATLSLDPGSYTITATATGYIGYTSTVQTVQSPGTWVSTNSATLPISLTNVMPPAPPAGMITGYLYTQVPGTTIYYAMVLVPPGSGMQLNGLTQSHISDSSGLWSVPLYLGATYTFNSGGGPTNTILIPESGSLLELQNLLSL